MKRFGDILMDFRREQGGHTAALAGNKGNQVLYFTLLLEIYIIKKVLRMSTCAKRSQGGLREADRQSKKGIFEREFDLSTAFTCSPPSNKLSIHTSPRLIATKTKRQKAYHKACPQVKP